MGGAETHNMFRPKRLQLPIGLLFVLLITACQTSNVTPPMPPPPPENEAGDTLVTASPPEQAVDYVLLAGDGYQTSLEELRAGKIKPIWIITVMTDPAKVEYSRTLELLDEISNLGYNVRYQPAAPSP